MDIKSYDPKIEIKGHRPLFITPKTGSIKTSIKQAKTSILKIETDKEKKYLYLHCLIETPIIIKVTGKTKFDLLQKQKPLALIPGESLILYTNGNANLPPNLEVLIEFTKQSQVFIQVTYSPPS